MRYADIVLPLAQPLYTFAVAEGVTLCEGMAVVVPFGRSKIYTGIVWRLHDRRPDFKTVKTVSRVLYGTPLLDERQRRFWEWVADYYMCTLGEVMRVALPSLMKPSGHGEEEFAADEFRPRREWFVALAGEALTADGLAAALERMGRRAPRQREALEELAALAPDGAEVARSRLAADRTALALLVKKGLLTCIEREVAPGPVTGGAQFRLPTLSAAQRKAAEEIRAVFADRATVLLRGVTGSGKTEIYMHFAARGAGPGRTSAAARAGDRSHGPVGRSAPAGFRRAGDRLSFETHRPQAYGALPPLAGFCGRRAGDRGPFGDLPAAAPPGAGRGGRGTRSQLQTDRPGAPLPGTRLRRADDPTAGVPVRRWAALLRRWRVI